MNAHTRLLLLRPSFARYIALEWSGEIVDWFLRNRTRSRWRITNKHQQQEMRTSIQSFSAALPQSSVLNEKCYLANLGKTNQWYMTETSCNFDCFSSPTFWCELVAIKMKGLHVWVKLSLHSQLHVYMLCAFDFLLQPVKNY